jgi:hypothetical protein
MLGEFSEVEKDRVVAQLNALAANGQSVVLIVVAPPAVEVHHVLFLLPASAEIPVPSASRSACDTEAARRALQVIALAPASLQVSYRVATTWRHAIRLLNEQRAERVVVVDEPYRLRDRRLVRRAGLQHCHTPTAPGATDVIAPHLPSELISAVPNATSPVMTSEAPHGY